MKITDKKIEDFINEVTEKHWISKERLASTKRGNVDSNIMSARVEIINYLINNRVKVKEIANILNVTKAIVYPIIRKIENEPEKYDKINNELLKKIPLKLYKPKDDIIIELLLKEKKRCEEGIKALDIVIKLYAEQ